ncbi:two-component system chemotaxis sensor kinase CheA [Herbinix hemicellulosilytica]|uniref:Chemotaxis protein CheA n=1 Tax=Herbinix hemicellulosilytica TaxID=1564487 RepID=A0A0H5SID0_HERHM|nr:chemotaxis protein CheA [Herbinix hemicellulosilytica]RBP60846.1 two-component system chemotaxis sensor kinase CheA [Herbinix hemicellulosilytica]CRZ34541.1 Chemotaxis protein CheA [Herbinix hemicellulosilytica]
MDVSQYLEIFIEETKEHLQSLNEHILVLEKEPENEATINEIFRAAHSLKGMAGTMGFQKMQRLTHDMENVFSEIRNGKMKATSDLIDVLFKGLDVLETYLVNIQSEGTEGDYDSQDIIDALNQILDKGSGKAATSQAVQKPNDTKKAVADTGKYKFLSISLEEHEKMAVAKAASLNLNVIGLTVYIQEDCMLKGARAFMINRVLEEHGEIIKLHPSAQDLEDEKFDFDFSAFIITNETPDKIIEYVMSVSEIKEVVADYIRLDENEFNTYMTAIKQDEEGTSAPKAPKELDSLKEGGPKQPKQTGKPVANRSVRVDIEKLDVLMNLVSELIIAKNSIVSSSSAFDQQANPEFFDQIEYLERITSNLHESVMKVRMVPIESVVNRFPRMIRDLSKTLDKEMELFMTGEDTELDRTVIDEIGDPLMHLLRNAADHGLESREERIKAGKNPVGSIFLDAYQDGNNVVIEVRDDGKGIDVEKVKKVAIERGVITPEQAERMSDKEIIDILFVPSFSTASKVTDVSGRGVGLDVVKSKIEALGGEIEARTKKNVGSNFIIRLPLTLAIMQALMVKISSEKYALPLGNIQTVENVASKDIKIVNNTEVLDLRGKLIPIIRLGDILDCNKGEDKDELFVVVVKKGERMAGMVVDELLGQQEIVIKSIGKFIKAHKIISGATILGNGEVALILDVNSLI